MYYKYKFIGNLWAGKQAASAGIVNRNLPPIDKSPGWAPPEISNREDMQALIKKLNSDFAVITDFELYRVEETNATHTITDNKGVPLEVTVTTKAKYRLMPWEGDKGEETYNNLALNG